MEPTFPLCEFAPPSRHPGRVLRLLHTLLPRALSRGHRSHLRICRAIFSRRRTRKRLRRTVSSRKVRGRRQEVAAKLLRASMLTKRIIACLDVNAGRVVNGVKFLNLRDAGDPAELAEAHSAAGADEIALLDISATAEQRSTLLDTVRRTATKLFIPFTVGGGIRSLDDATAVFDAGADKVSINS